MVLACVLFFVKSRAVGLDSLQLNFGETFSVKAEEVIGYLVAKNILGSLYAQENDTFDNFFLPVLTTTFAVLPKALGISHLNKAFHC